VIHQAVGRCIELMREHRCSAILAARGVVKYEEYCTISAEAMEEMKRYSGEDWQAAMTETRTGGQALLDPVKLARAVGEAISG